MVMEVIAFIGFVGALIATGVGIILFLTFLGDCYKDWKAIYLSFALVIVFISLTFGLGYSLFKTKFIEVKECPIISQTFNEGKIIAIYKKGDQACIAETTQYNDIINSNTLYVLEIFFKNPMGGVIDQSTRFGYKTNSVEKVEKN